MRLSKIREIGASHICLQQFDKFWVENSSPETEIYVNWMKSAWKKSWNHHGWTYFLAGFRRLEPLCVGCRKRAKPSKNESESPAENSVTEFSMRSEARKTCWFFWPFSRSWNEIRTWNFEGRHRVHSARKDKVRLQSRVELRLEKLPS